LEAEGKGINEEKLWNLAKDPQVVARGAALFKQNCLSCHGDRGQGVIGPNLTDSYWLHGDKAMDVYKTISSGVLDKGMPAWRPLLGVNKVQDAAAFVLTFRDKNISGKPPQGVTATGQVAP
jgi:cytochrome c oxidase cbb3-type subunit 3